MKFCDMTCRYAQWPNNNSVDGSRSCRTYQAIFCKKKKQLVYKNSICSGRKRKELNE